jgi:hypothetical protein
MRKIFILIIASVLIMQAQAACSQTEANTAGKCC